MNYELDADELIFTTQNNTPTNLIGPIAYQGTVQGIYYPSVIGATQYVTANPNINMTNFYGNTLSVLGMTTGASINTYSNTVPTNIFKNFGTGSVQTIASTSSTNPNGCIQIVAALNDSSPIIGSNYTYSSGSVKVLTGGLYEITAMITYSPDAAGLVDCMIFVNGLLEYNYLGTHTTTVATTRGYIIPVLLNANDTIKLYGWQNSGSTLTIQSASLSVYKVAEV